MKENEKFIDLVSKQPISVKLAMDFIASENPDIVSIMLGANDGAGTTQAQFKERIKAVIDIIQASCSADILFRDGIRTVVTKDTPPIQNTTPRTCSIRAITK